MGVPRALVFFFTIITFMFLVMLIKKHRNLDFDVVVYSLGDSEDLEGDEKDDPLFVRQVTKKALGDGDLLVEHVPFNKNGQDYIIALVKVINYNSRVSNAEFIKEEKEDTDFWVMINAGSIGTNSVTVEINSFIDINCDVEFYGYKKTE